MSTSRGSMEDHIPLSQGHGAPGFNFEFERLNGRDSQLPTPEPVLQSNYSATQDIEEIDVAGFEFELHYGVSGRKAEEILEEILVDMSSHKQIHDWDAKIAPDSVKVLAATARKYLNGDYFGLILGLNTLIAYSMVEEVLLVGGVNERLPARKDMDDTASHIFFTKNAFKKAESLHSSNQISIQDKTDCTTFSQGRIIQMKWYRYIKEHIPHVQMASLLLLYAFCIRLQYEDYGFIRGFIERHLSLRTIVKMPYHWQQEKQKCYRRVSLSCHITYLTMTSNEEGSRKRDSPNSTPPIISQKCENEKNANSIHLSKESSSTLLTIVIPEQSISKEEEIELLRNPKGLWTVLVVNSPSELASDYEPRHNLTPISQFLRGIVASLCTQRINAQLIYGELRDVLADRDNNSIFDDENFTKSTLYHWTIKTCEEVGESISSSLRFMRRVKKSQVDKLCKEAHAHEKLGIDHWSHQIEEEMFGLEDLRAQILALSAQVQESRNAV
ncbi:hypothetical protein G7Y89_g2524 [Cudoniella acicularis]|uniref:Uncharacterized protein n=1 Tax=Cudoniella acicularis TaxID=354080 RepID=A0A8H4W6W2_9HELO|nr:hypothetical protein G7Y89_g2524 [Cudoniella acicularis]